MKVTWTPLKPLTGYQFYLTGSINPYKNTFLSLAQRSPGISFDLIQWDLLGNAKVFCALQNANLPPLFGPIDEKISNDGSKYVLAMVENEAPRIKDQWTIVTIDLTNSNITAIETPVQPFLSGELVAVTAIGIPNN